MTNRERLAEVLVIIDERIPHYEAKDFRKLSYNEKDYYQKEVEDAVTDIWNKLLVLEDHL